MQCSLFQPTPNQADRSLDAGERNWIGHGAWIDYVCGYLPGHERVYEQLAAHAQWVSQRRQMYDRVVDVPRLTARLPVASPVTERVKRAGAELESRYGVALPSVSLVWYRDGCDSVAPHGDKIGAVRGETVIATISLGARGASCCARLAAERPSNSNWAGATCW